MARLRLGFIFAFLLVFGCAAGVKSGAPNGAPAVREGLIPFHGYHVWYRIVGDHDDPGKLPLLCLHGGPGATHDYLEPLEPITATGRRVVFYDQLGGGKSDHPHDPQLWTVSLFVDELGTVRQALGLDHVHILGQSWGGMLAMEYALTQPRGLASLILADAPASMPQWVSEANRLRAELPADVQQNLLKHERAGSTEDPEYQRASGEYYHRYLYRGDSMPDYLQRSLDSMTKYPEVYNVMNGPSEFFVTGVLKDWDITQRLGEIHVPTLVVGGRFDEATPEITATVHRGIPGSEYVIFEHSAHMPHVEEAEQFRQVLTDFLNRVERNAR